MYIVTGYKSWIFSILYITFHYCYSYHEFNVNSSLIVDVSRITLDKSNKSNVKNRRFQESRRGRGGSPSIMTDRARIYSSEDDVSSKKQISRIHEPSLYSLWKKKEKKKVNLGREGGPAALERVKYPKHRMETPFIKSKCLDFLNGRGIQSLGVARHNSVVCLSWNAGQQKQGFFQYPSNGPRQLARANLYGKNTLNLPLVFLICG